MLKPPNSVGTILMFSVKDPMIFSFGSKNLCVWSKIAPLWTIVRTRDENSS